MEIALLFFQCFSMFFAVHVSESPLGAAAADGALGRCIGCPVVSSGSIGLHTAHRAPQGSREWENHINNWKNILFCIFYISTNVLDPGRALKSILGLKRS